MRAHESFHQVKDKEQREAGLVHRQNFTYSPDHRGQGSIMASPHHYHTISHQSVVSLRCPHHRGQNTHQNTGHIASPGVTKTLRHITAAQIILRSACITPHKKHRNLAFHLTHHSLTHMHVSYGSPIVHARVISPIVHTLYKLRRASWLGLKVSPFRLQPL